MDLATLHYEVGQKLAQWTSDQVFIIWKCL